MSEWVSEIRKNGPFAVRRQKALISRWEEISLEGGIEASVEAFGSVLFLGKMVGVFENGGFLLSKD